MSLSNQPLPPTSSLPPLRPLESLTGEQISTALRNLHALYCPLPRTVDFAHASLKPKQTKVLSIATTPIPADSGYASGNEDEDNVEDAEDALQTLRADVYERNFAIKWLTVFIARAEELRQISEDERELAIEDAASVLASFSDPTGQNDEEDAGLIRDFSFALSLPERAPNKIQIQVNDAPLTGADHTDVGLQSWGASIVLSDLMCSSPARFGLGSALGSSPRFIELGAGTGLISLMLAKLLPHLEAETSTIIATDYHLSVLANLRSNIDINFAARTPPTVETCLLDWSAPSSEPPLDKPANMLVAADVVYAPEHAIWLRDCAALLLAPDGVFWLIVTVRMSGKFEGISNTVETAFAAGGCPKANDGRILRILDVERLKKRRGIGRGDESGYKLFRIGWA